uniref:serine/threonine-protein kinase n=1 Tax=Nonomuraea pusilla TaxID=46177 RepID=UPI000AD4A2EC
MEQEGTSLMEPTGAAPLRPTDLREVGPYRLLGRLGEGGMGTVFLARTPAGRFVAVKVVKAEFANQEGFAARFHAEVENARRVASFCTAQVLDNGDTGDGRPFMVTEFIQGTPLSAQIARHGALEPGPLHGVALGVAAALAAIHVAGLVHRDLKPANVILSLSGPRVIDFGISRALDRETGFTLSGELLGSPGWWAPEQVRGLSVTPAADVFAWGCLVAYAGNGRHPFGRGDAVTLATRVLNERPDLGVLPAPLDSLVRRATSMDPARRPTAQELLLALVGSGAAAVSADADPPTIVATEMLTGWQPPRNVAEAPDVTAEFTTPPPGPPGGAEPPRTTAAGRGTRPGLPDELDTAGGPGTTNGPSGRPGGPGTTNGPSGRPGVPGSGDVPDRPDGPGERDVLGAPRAARVRWLIAGAAAVLAIAATAAVLASTSGRSTGEGGAARVAPPSGSSDVGRRLALGPAFDDPVAVLAAPECGVKEYEGRTQTLGQLCVVPFTLVNPGGEQRGLAPRPDVALVDDRGAAHVAVVAALPPVLAPGGRADGAFVFDLPARRKPVKMTAVLMDAGGRIEVAL